MKRKLIRTAKDLEKLIWDKVLEEFSKAKSTKEIDGLLNNLLTSQERENIARRLAVFSLIRKGQSYRKISEKLWVSPVTISVIKKTIFGNRGYHSRSEFDRDRKIQKVISGNDSTEPESMLSELLDYIEFVIATIPQKNGLRWRFLTTNRTMPKKYWGK